MQLKVVQINRFLRIPPSFWKIPSWCMYFYKSTVLHGACNICLRIVYILQSFIDIVRVDYELQRYREAAAAAARGHFDMVLQVSNSGLTSMDVEAMNSHDKAKVVVVEMMARKEEGEEEKAMKLPNTVDMSYTVEDSPPIYLSFLLGLQHYLTMFGGTVSIPFLLCPALCIEEDDPANGYIISTIFFVSGIVTLLQERVIRFQDPFSCIVDKNNGWLT